MIFEVEIMVNQGWLPKVSVKSKGKGDDKIIIDDIPTTRRKLKKYLKSTIERSLNPLIEKGLRKALEVKDEI